VVVDGLFDKRAGLDLAVAARNDQQLDTLLNDGSGLFAPGPGSPYALGSTAGKRSVASGDLNGDGLDDLVASSPDAATPYLANPNGRFTVLPDITAGDIRDVAIADFDGDADPDVLIVSVSGGRLNAQVYLGDGVGGFTAGPAPVDLGPDSTEFIAVGEFTGDHVADVAVANFTSHQLTVLQNDGSGALSVTSQSPILLGGPPSRLASADLNDDGADDLVIPIFGGTMGAQVLLGKGDGSFDPPNDIPASLLGTGSSSVAVNDFDSDGKLDLAFGQQGTPGPVKVLLGDDTGRNWTLGTTAFAGGNDVATVVADDFNGDGNPDLATANEPSSSVSTIFAKPPTMTTSPGSLGFGDVTSGATSGTQTLTVSNGGPQWLVVDGTLTGDQRNDFQLVDNRCQGPVAPGGSCTIGARFKPGSTGSKSASLQLDTNAGRRTVGLSGNGVNAPTPAATPVPTMQVIPIFDTTPPKQTIMFPRQSLRSVLRDGLIMFASCSEPCFFRAQTQVKSSTRAKRKRRGRAARAVTAGATTAELAGVRHRVVIKIRKSARAALTRQHKLTLRTIATDTLGNASRTARAIKLNRSRR
jgi:hypothetical protein